MPIAIIHDWLTVCGGAERVLQQMLKVYPDADLFSLVDFLPEKDRGFLLGKPVQTSFIQKLPGACKHYRRYFPLMPIAVEQFDLSRYDLVISSSHSVAKGVLIGPDQLHICMCYSPVRYAWDLQHQYLEETGLNKGLKGCLTKWMLHKIRLWDIRTSNGVDKFIAISNFIARRIWRTYRRKSVVIYPPVDVSFFSLRENKQDFYLTASRMVPYKKVDKIIEAFNAMPERRLVVIGDGPDLSKLRSKAGPNVIMRGREDLDVLRDHLQRARAFLFAAEEDFGITPVEAQACGTPVIAYGKGGARESIRGLDSDKPTGVFFSIQNADAIIQAVQTFEREKMKITPDACRDNSLRFSTDRFLQEFSACVESVWKDWHTAVRPPHARACCKMAGHFRSAG